MSPPQENPGSDSQSGQSRQIQRRPLPISQQGSARDMQGHPVPASNCCTSSTSTASEQGDPSFATQSTRPGTLRKYQLIPVVY